MNSTQKLAADKLAYEVAQLIDLGRIGTRSKAADALLNYLEIGNYCDSPTTVPEWVEEYRRKTEAQG